MLFEFVIISTNYELWSPVSPLTPLGGFLWFPPGEQIYFFGPWTDDANASCGKFMESRKLLTLEVYRLREVASLWTSSNIDSFIISHNTTAVRDASSLTPFERLFVADLPKAHKISELYQLLGSVTPEPKPLFVQAWEQDLGLEISATQLAHLHQLSDSSSLDSKVQETNKIL